MAKFWRLGSVSSVDNRGLCVQSTGVEKTSVKFTAHCFLFTNIARFKYSQTSQRLSGRPVSIRARQLSRNHVCPCAVVQKIQQTRRDTSLPVVATTARRHREEFFILANKTRQRFLNGEVALFKKLAFSRVLTPHKRFVYRDC